MQQTKSFFNTSLTQKLEKVTNHVILVCKFPWLFVGKPKASFSAWFLEFQKFLASECSVYSSRQVVATGPWAAAAGATPVYRQFK